MARRSGSNFWWRGERVAEQMSKYEETTTELRDAGHLIAALSELGYRAEFHPNSAALVGYEGRERPEKAHVIVRRDQLEIGRASCRERVYVLV